MMTPPCVSSCPAENPRRILSSYILHINQQQQHQTAANLTQSKTKHALSSFTSSTAIPTRRVCHLQQWSPIKRLLRIASRTWGDCPYWGRGVGRVFSSRRFWCEFYLLWYDYNGWCCPIHITLVYLHDMLCCWHQYPQKTGSWNRSSSRLRRSYVLAFFPRWTRGIIPYILRWLDQTMGKSSCRRPSWEATCREKQGTRHCDIQGCGGPFWCSKFQRNWFGFLCSQELRGYFICDGESEEKGFPDDEGEPQECQGSARVQGPHSAAQEAQLKNGMNSWCQPPPRST